MVNNNRFYVGLTDIGECIGLRTAESAVSKRNRFSAKLRHFRTVRKFTAADERIGPDKNILCRTA
jgi:hypothetical protein